MDSLPKSGVKSGTEHQVELLIQLKVQLDLVYRQLNQYRSFCKGVDRLNRTVRKIRHDSTEVIQSPLLNVFVKFKRNHRVLRRRICKLDRQLFAVNVYDKLCNLYESLVNGESAKAENLIDLSGKDPAVVEIDYTPVKEFAGILIESNFGAEVNEEKILTADACRDTKHLETLNHTPTKFPPDVNDSARVTRQQTRQRMANFTSFPRKSCSSKFSATVDEARDSRPVEIVEDTPVHDLNPLISINQNPEDCLENKLDTRQLKSSNLTTSNDFSSFQQFKCLQCNKSYKSQNSLSLHKRIHGSEPRYKCSWEGCNYRTRRSSDLKKHQTVHTGERHFPCDQCDKSFKRSSHLSTHKRTHTTKVRYKCSVEGCDYDADLYTNLKVHQNGHVENGERPFHCDQCDRSYNRRESLSKHKHTHKRDPRYKCSAEGCDFRTYRSDRLKAHQAAHTDERPFQCSQCDKSFKTSHDRRQHMRTHEREPRYKCSWEGCHFCSNHHVRLKTHEMAVHTGERPFQCPQCDKSFTTSSHFGVHKRIHHSEPNPEYRCHTEGCHFVCHNSSTLKKHETSVHVVDRKLFQCLQCDKSFETLNNFREHKRTHQQQQQQQQGTNKPRFRCIWEGCHYGSNQLVQLTKHQNVTHVKSKLKL